VVGDVDGEEAGVEDSLALGEGDTALVLAGRGHDLAESGGETVERLGGTSNDEHGRGVEEGDGDLRVLGQERVNLGNVTLEGLAAQAVDAEHGRGNTLVVGDRVGNNLGLNGEEREALLATETDVEEKGDGLLNVLVEALPRGRRSDSDGRDDTLRVAGGALEAGGHLTGGEVGDLGADNVPDELGNADKGQGEGDRGEVLDSGAGRGALEPRDHVEALAVVGEAIGIGLGGKRDKNLVGEIREELLNEGAVDVKERLELVEVVLKS